MSDIGRNQPREEYRLLLLPAESSRLLAYREGTSWRLPRISIPKWTRPAERLQQAVQRSLGLHIIVLDLATGELPHSHCVVAEVRSSHIPDHLTPVRWEQICEEDLLGREKEALRGNLAGMRGPFSQPGWIDEAIAWVQSAIPSAAIPLNGIHQYNAGARFALVRFAVQGGSAFWLKATGEPNLHEFDLTVCLSSLSPHSLPRLVAVRPEWNAWLTEEAGLPLSEPATALEMESATRVLATLQQATTECTDVLLAAGAFDWRLPILVDHIDEIVQHLIDAMARQTSNKVLPLTWGRLRELQLILRDACDQMEALGIPDTLLHNDLNAGNILYDGSRSVFTDWSEAAVGNPLLSFERLCQLDTGDYAHLREVYRASWRERLGDECIDQAFALMPLLAVFAHLYGRGDWLHSEQGKLPQFESYARSLARRMDRAARNPILQEALCR